MHDLSPVALRFGALELRWYGLAYIAGFLICWLLIRRLSLRGLCLLPAERVPDAIFAFMIGVLVGGRLGYVAFYRPDLFIDFSASFPFWGVLRINEGGMASHGGIVGSILACVYIAWRSKISLLHLLDMIALAAPFGLFLGRLANFVNGELLGRVVAGRGQVGPWWSVRYPQEIVSQHLPPMTSQEQVEFLALLGDTAPTLIDPFRPTSEQVHSASMRLIELIQRGDATLKAQLEPLLTARMPSQLMQAFVEGPVLAGVLWLVWMKPRRAGVVGCWFLITYGALRVLSETWRLPDDHLVSPRIAGMTRGQWLSALMIVAGVSAIFLIRRKGGEAIGGWREARKNAATETE